MEEWQKPLPEGWHWEGYEAINDETGKPYDKDGFDVNKIDIKRYNKNNRDLSVGNTERNKDNSKRKDGDER